MEAEPAANDDPFPLAADDPSHVYFQEDTDPILNDDPLPRQRASRRREYTKSTKRAKVAPSPAEAQRIKNDSSQERPAKKLPTQLGFNRKFYSTSISSEDEVDILRAQIKPTKPALVLTQPSSGSSNGSTSSSDEEDIPFINTKIPPPSISIHDKGSLEALEQIFDSDSDE